MLSPDCFGSLFVMLIQRFFELLALLTDIIQELFGGSGEPVSGKVVHRRPCFRNNFYPQVRSLLPFQFLRLTPQHSAGLDLFFDAGAV